MKTPKDFMPQYVKSLVAVAVVGVLAGCASVGPDYQRPALDLPEAMPKSTAAGGIDGEKAGARWWTQFNDARLAALIDDALQYNADLQAAVARVDEARALAALTDSAQKPTVSAGLDAGRGRERGVTANSFGARLHASYELDLWGRLRRASEAGRAGVVAAEADREALRRSIAAEVAHRYFALVAMQEQLAATRDTERFQSEALDIHRRRLQLGDLSAYDLAAREAEYASVQARRVALEEARERTARSLAVLAGRTPRQLVAEAVTETAGGAQPASPVPALADGMRSDALLARPDVRAAEQQLVAANARVGEARAAWFPTIALTGAGGFASNELSSLFDGPSRVFQIVGALTQPIFNGGRIAANEAAAEARRKQAEAHYRQVVANAFRDTLDALAAYRYATEAAELQRQRGDALGRALQLSRLRLQQGVSSQLEVIDAERQSLAAAVELAEARRAQRAAAADVWTATGVM